LGHFHFAWHIPELRHPDIRCWTSWRSCLAAAAARGYFRKSGKKAGWSHSIEAWTYSPGNPGLFGVSATADANKFESGRDAILGEIEKMKSTPVLADELAKAVKPISLGNAFDPQDDARSGAGSGRFLAGCQRSELFATLSRAVQRVSLRTSKGSPANI
jgi:hypothetical protein